MSSPPADTRARILEATWRLMEERRGQGVRMSDIAKAAGVSRQAVYLHFSSRTELLVATARYIDEASDVDGRLERYRAAASGEAMIDAFVAFWGSYIPVIYGIARAFVAVRDSDEAAAEAWRDRMDDVKDSCRTMVATLADEGRLNPDLNPEEATDLFAMLLSVHNWAQLTSENGWPLERYIDHMQRLVKRALVDRESRGSGA